MNYKNYKKSRDMAWQILINEKVNALPVSVSGLSKSMGIEMRYYESTDDNDGKSTERLKSQSCVTSAYKPQSFV